MVLYNSTKLLLRTTTRVASTIRTTSSPQYLQIVHKTTHSSFNAQTSISSSLSNHSKAGIDLTNGLLTVLSWCFRASSFLHQLSQKTTYIHVFRLCYCSSSLRCSVYTAQCTFIIFQASVPKQQHQNQE